ncbi:beta-lactamase/transpeptidase-like protein [Lophiotrema nucula]|uniref:Beta-lactamase/transpeptidase-like protein n=1 Tax=Lophiotrema nucula TaxID=690887 RepID=A0A6A5YNJ8_9PLEO|nr:beta-lactamase/transpeptidase-like protein [Lophiotrema nucula]
MQFLAFLLSLSTVTASGLCPVLGPVFPPVKSLHDATTLHTAFNKTQLQLDDAFRTGNSSKGPISPNRTYSLEIFSASDAKPLFEYHHRGANLVNTTGPIGGDSVYRVGSFTKLLTIYLLLLEAGDGILHEPVTKYLPELKGKDDWDEMTVGALASHLGGLAADCKSLDYMDATEGSPGGLSPDGGFPQLPKNEQSPCVFNETHCSRAEVLKAVRARPRTYLPYTTPAYSNTGFVLLGMILETVAGKSYEDVLQSALVEPLHLKGTTSSIPKSVAGGVIISDPTSSGWYADFRGITAMGGAFSSTHDLATIGRSILASSLLPSNTTRAWLKPATFTSSLTGGVGMPWEIYRASLDAKNNRVVDIYTKGGEVGVYTAILALMPDYDVGFAVAMASEVGETPYPLNDLIVETLLPALEEVGREQAHARFAGTYTATNINSTITLSTSPGKSGLKIDRWISNSTNDIVKAFGDPEDFRAYFTNVESEDGKEVHWRANSGFTDGGEGNGPFTSCQTWLNVDRPTWGLYGLDDFTFHLGKDGKVDRLEVKALKVVLEKQ